LWRERLLGRQGNKHPGKKKGKSDARGEKTSGKRGGGQEIAVRDAPEGEVGWKKRGKDSNENWRIWIPGRGDRKQKNMNREPNFPPEPDTGGEKSQQKQKREKEGQVRLGWAKMTILCATGGVEFA